jgi:hypothetical protein
VSEQKESDEEVTWAYEVLGALKESKRMLDNKEISEETFGKWMAENFKSILTALMFLVKEEHRGVVLEALGIVFGADTKE